MVIPPGLPQWASMAPKAVSAPVTPPLGTGVDVVGRTAAANITVALARSSHSVEPGPRGDKCRVVVQR